MFFGCPTTRNMVILIISFGRDFCVPRKTESHGAAVLFCFEVPRTVVCKEIRGTVGNSIKRAEHQSQALKPRRGLSSGFHPF